MGTNIKRLFLILAGLLALSVSVAWGATFGYTTNASTTAYAFAGRQMCFSTITLTEAGTATSISAWCQNISGTTAYNAKIGLYNVNTSTPTTLAITEVEVAVPIAFNGWLTVTVNQALSPGKYQISAEGNSDNVKWFYAAVTGSDTYYKDVTYSNAFTSPFGAGSVHSDHQYIGYVTYTASGGGGSSAAQFPGVIGIW